MVERRRGGVRGNEGKGRGRERAGERGREGEREGKQTAVQYCNHLAETYSKIPDTKLSR